MLVKSSSGRPYILNSRPSLSGELLYLSGDALGPRVVGARAESGRADRARGRVSPRHTDQHRAALRQEEDYSGNRINLD